MCGDRPLDHDDLDRLPYARQVLQEAVRKYGPAWMVTRTATRDIDLGGHHIPQGADVVWSPYPHQHDPAYFPSPGASSRSFWRPYFSSGPPSVSPRRLRGPKPSSPSSPTR
ncbi:cytochrome P450 [Streptomyces spinoverrucosus]|uniref:cytochrome P450 n=1 Tax=Streptomyces spinoverrucosus TaxID=284043 RepID=UPI00403A9537